MLKLSASQQQTDIGENNITLAARVATIPLQNKKLSYCWETVRRESMPRTAEMDVEMTT